MADTLNELVSVSLEDHVAIVSMNEPARRNVFSTRMRRALIAAFEPLMSEDGPARAIVLTGAGDHFCGGGDLSEMTTAPPTIPMRERIAVATRLIKLMHGGAKPVVAAVEGQCVGAGLSLVTACDFAVGSTASRYTCAFVKVGLMPDTGILWTLQQKVGLAKARELMLTAAAFDAREAHRIGVLSHLAEPGQALAAAKAEAARLAQLPPVTVMLLKGALVNGMNSMASACRHETDLNPLVRMTDDHQEAVRSFLEKRRPSFAGQ